MGNFLFIIYGASPLATIYIISFFSILKSFYYYYYSILLFIISSNVALAYCDSNNFINSTLMK